MTNRLPVTVLYLLKDSGETYVFHYNNSPDSKKATLRQFGRFASSDELDFSWYDAAVLSQKVRAKRE